MTDELQRAVARLNADLLYAKNGPTAITRTPDLLLSERAELLATVERMRGEVADWAERIDAITWTVNTSALDQIISEMRCAALTTGEEK